MDFLTQQFLAAAKHLRGELVSLRESIDALRSQKEQHYQQEQTNRILPQPPVEIEAEIHEKPGEDHPYEERNLRVQWVIAIATSLAFLAAAIYAGIASCQLKETQKAVGEASRAAAAAETANTDARDRFRRDERPYITMNPTGSMGSLGIVSVGPNAGHLRLEFELMNYGRSPGIEIGRDGRIAIGSQQAEQIKLDASTDRLTRIIPPGDKQKIAAYSVGTVSKDTFRNILGGKTLVVIYGHVEYTDTLAEPRPTYLSEFCTPVVTTYEAGREADKYCQGHISMK